MSAVATDAELEALLSSDEPEELHLTCGYCWPPGDPGVAVCGQEASGNPPSDGSGGKHKCARCLALERTSPLPCGHP